MDPFTILRKQAAEKRDAIILAARAEYAQAKKRINALRLQLGATPQAPAMKLRRIADVIADAIPRDQTFTIGEVAEMLVKAEPGRRFSQPTVRTSCQRLEAVGTMRRVGRVNGKTLWAHADYTGRVDPNCAKRLPEIAADVLRACGPLRSADLLVRIRERGYRVNDNQRTVLKAMRTAMYRNRAFQRDKNGRWSVSFHA